ncbi:hypothetical protein [Oleidesulfovibrio alaskensis]
MTHDSRFPVKIRYEYKQDDKTSLQYAHGVWGGINPHGEIEMNFYSESDKIPAWSERVVMQDGALGHEMVPAESDSKTVVRHIHSKVLINYDTARAIYDWLDEKLSALEMEEDQQVMYSAGKGGLEQ